jgi:exoribonuclease R
MTSSGNPSEQTINPQIQTPITLVGVVELASKYRYGLTSRGVPLFLFRSYDEAWPAMVVGSSERDLTRNRIGVVEVTPEAVGSTTVTKIRGNLLRLLGPVGDPVAERAGLLAHYCPWRTERHFADEDTTDDSHREEISAATGWLTFHIDPAGCRDVDDAMAWHADTLTWAITIADAAACVPANSSVDETARNIGATFYDEHGTVVRPMLPPTISEESASLLPGNRRRGVTLFTDAAGAVKRWALTWITVSHSFTYENFPTSAVAASLGLTGVDPHEWVADAMIRYNAAAAQLLHDAGTGLLRVQKQTDVAMVASWPPALAHLANEAASYEPTGASQAQSHSTLGLAAYCHASSPLRRYADLLNQRAIKALLGSRESSTLVSKGSSPTITVETADHLNDRMKANRRWSRDLTFLAHVTPGKVHEIDVTWVSEGLVWVPAWGRLLRLRHDEEHAVGTEGRIQIFCDPTRRNWKRRVLTAPVTDV